MPKKDLYHDLVRLALEKDGWNITHDPMRFRWRGRTIWPDLGVEKIIAAERGTEQIAVEIKSFTTIAVMASFYEAIGQYDVYVTALSELDPGRKVVLAVPQNAYDDFFSTEFVQTIISTKGISLLVYDPQQVTITLWIK
ncbi:MAG: XisH family protein [Bacteroidota bacterium]